MKAVYIVLGLVAVGVIAWLVFGNKSNSSTDTTGDASADAAPVNWFNGFGTGNSSQTWNQWFNQRSSENWAFKTTLI